MVLRSSESAPVVYNRFRGVSFLLSLLIALIGASPLLRAGELGADKAAPWRVGYAEADITPAPG